MPCATRQRAKSCCRRSRPEAASSWSCRTAVAASMPRIYRTFLTVSTGPTRHANEARRRKGQLDRARAGHCPRHRHGARWRHQRRVDTGARVTLCCHNSHGETRVERRTTGRDIRCDGNLRSACAYAPTAASRAPASLSAGSVCQAGRRHYGRTALCRALPNDDSVCALCPLRGGHWGVRSLPSCDPEVW